MAVKYKDYYETLGVARGSSQDEIKAAYRKLARKHHPDVSKAKDAEDRFKEIGEAYEVLGDPEKRRKYDQLGSAWHTGDEFSPPHGWETHVGRGAAGFGGFGRQSTSFSDFFESIFGGGMGGVGGFGADTAAARGEDQEVRVRLSLEDAFAGGERTIALQFREATVNGRVRHGTRNIRVKIPAGVTSGQRIRLAGQGAKSPHGGEPGDLYLVIELAPHERLRVQGRDLYMDLPVAPWEAALGANIVLPTLAGNVSLTIPPGTSSGQKMRLRGKGMPNPAGLAGDLYVEVKIAVPKTLSAKEREVWQELAKNSKFNPRS